MPAPATQGFLAVFSDVKPEDETDYLHWLTREHVQERLGVPGFLGVRVFRAQAEGAARFLICYRLSAPDVVASSEYLTRLNAPSEWSQRIMPKLSNFMRGGGRIVCEAGSGEGGFVLPILFEAAELARYRAAAEAALAHDRIVAARIFETDRNATAVATSEKAMRKGDATFSAMLLLEGLDQRALQAVTVALPALKANGLSSYAQVFTLRTSRG